MNYTKEEINEIEKFGKIIEEMESVYKSNEGLLEFMDKNKQKLKYFEVIFPWFNCSIIIKYKSQVYD